MFFLLFHGKKYAFDNLRNMNEKKVEIQIKSSNLRSEERMRQRTLVALQSVSSSLLPLGEHLLLVINNSTSNTIANTNTLQIQFNILEK